LKKLLNEKAAMTLSMVIFGTIGLFVRNIPLPSGEIAFYRAVLALIFIGVVLVLTKEKFVFSEIKKDLIILFLSGIAMGFNWILLFEAYKYTTVSVATLSYYFAPVIVMLLCPVLFKERMSAKKWLCFIMSTLGLVLITATGEMSFGSSHFKGILLGLSAAVLYATVILLNKYIKGVSGLQKTFLQFISAAALLFFYVIFTDGVNIISLGSVGWVCILTVGVIHTGFAYCLYFGSISKLSGQTTAILSYIDPLVAVFISVTILREKMTVMQIIGGLLILGFTLFNEFSENKE
jgi:RarD protein